MNDKDPNDEIDHSSRREFASSPCMMHEIDPNYLGLDSEPHRPADVASWRKSERQRLISDRRSVPAETRQLLTNQITVGLDSVIGDVSGHTCSFYWPFRAEPNLRHWMEAVHTRGGICALPCVVKRKQPLVFCAWEPGIPMERGIWNIPVPVGSNAVTPDIVIVPVVGFDQACYRLGYGGGYFDRTLAAMSSKPHVIGVGYSQAEIATIYPQKFDIPMDVIVTEQNIFRR